MCVGFAEVETVEPSPKFQLKLASEPSTSAEPNELKTTACGALPAATSELATAVGAWFGVETIATVAWVLSPLSSVTVKVAV